MMVNPRTPELPSEPDLFGKLEFSSRFYLPDDDPDARDSSGQLRIFVKVVGREDHSTHSFDTSNTNAIYRDRMSNNTEISAGHYFDDQHAVLVISCVGVLQS